MFWLVREPVRQLYQAGRSGSVVIGARMYGPRHGRRHGKLFSQAQMIVVRSEEHTSELQSLRHLVCRLLLEKKKHTYSSVGTSRRSIEIRKTCGSQTVC